MIEFPGQPARFLRFDEQRGQLGGRQEPDPIVVLAAGHAQGDGKMGLAGTTFDPTGRGWPSSAGAPWSDIAAKIQRTMS